MDLMKTLHEYLELAAVAHGHLCAGQVLGVRLAMLGIRELGFDPIAERKRIVTYVEIHPEDLPGFKGPRVVCAQCGEGINFKREVLQNGRTLCRACAGECYYAHAD